MLDYNGTGMSVMEMSHRSKAFEEIINSAEQDLRDLMNIPDNYKVLFMQGGASQQFAMIPMNFMKNRVADYIITGQWAKKAAKEAEKYGKVNRIASSEDQTSHIFRIVPTCLFRKMRIMYTFVKTIRFTERSLKNFRTQREKH